jgi:hypothetical protein
MLRALGTAALVAAGVAATPLMLEARVARSEQEASDTWEAMRVRRRSGTLLGISFRPLQAEAFGLDPASALSELLELPFQMIRLGAYWNRIESRADAFDTGELDRQVTAAERAGKQIVLAVGAIKNFGYPELFVPKPQLDDGGLPDGALVSPSSNSALLSSASRFVRKIVERYRGHDSIVAWQLEHEAVDPRGMESSWRLSREFVEVELAALREVDANRPVMMNGFLPTSSAVRLQQGWRTRDQGDSLAVAARLADIVGIDYYPRHALFALGSRSVYLAGAQLPWQRALTRRLIEDVERRGKRVMVAEGQSEPWEAVTVPPSPGGRAMFSCRPADVIRNYNTAMDWTALYAYLFWGAEYWLLRRDAGDSSYLNAFVRVLEEA